MKTLVQITLFILMFLPAAAVAETPGGEQKVVLITGATTGIGRSMAELFASR